MCDASNDPRQSELSPDDREFYQAAYNLAPVMMHSLDASGRLVHVNDHWLKVMGYTRDEALGRQGPSFLTEASRRYAVEVGIPKTLDQGFIKEDPVQMVTKDGRTIDALVSSVIARSDDGEVLRSYAAIVDITRQKQAERRLSLQNAVLHTQQEVSLDGILVVDGDGNIVSYNRRFAEMWKLPDEILAKRDDARAIQVALSQIKEPDQFLAKVQHLYRNPEESSFDELQLVDGRHFDRYSAPMLGEAGQYFGRVWFFRDNTRRKRTEAALRKSEQRFAAILESAMDAIIAVDSERVIRLFNRAAEQVFGERAGRAIGCGVDRFLSPAFSELLGHALARNASRKSDPSHVWAPEGVTAIRTDGVEFPVEATLSQAEFEDGVLTTIILRNVNERHEAQTMLQRLQLQNMRLQEEIIQSANFNEIVGESAAIKKVLKDVSKVAVTDSTVLINGETGTGKELIARAIHRQSPRADEPLVAVNCAALPSGLIESELFGHEKGAFTGALTKKIGRFELADGGTLFLDEIGDLPLELQAKLLRVLQESEFERLGSAETIRVDVRLIAATHHNLGQAVSEKRFREDLFYRLSVVPVRVPPLRERAVDIPLLAKYFTSLFASKMGKRIDHLPERVLDTLSVYHWPGNIRELQNVIERAVILSDSAELELGEWPPATGGPAPPPHEDGTLAEVERHHITRMLERAGWKVSGQGGAAELLGLKPSTLESRMKKLGISRP